MTKKIKASKPLGYYTGRTFHYWTILEEFHRSSPNSTKKRPFMLAQCVCGTVKEVARHSITSGGSKSCGCLRILRIPSLQGKMLKSKWRLKRDDPRETLFRNAKSRAKIKNLPFLITPEDIVIPDMCPLLGIPLYKTKEKNAPNNPSLDRIIPVLGYVPDNIQVISYRANTLKRDCSFQELQTLVTNWGKLSQSKG